MNKLHTYRLLCLQRTDKLYKQGMHCRSKRSRKRSTCNIKEREYQTSSLRVHYSVPWRDPIDNFAMGTAKLAKNNRNEVYFVGCGRKPAHGEIIKHWELMHSVVN